MRLRLVHDMSVWGEPLFKILMVTNLTKQMKVAENYNQLAIVISWYKWSCEILYLQK